MPAAAHPPQQRRRRLRQLAWLPALGLAVLLGALAAAPGGAYVIGGRTIWTIAGNGVACAPGDLSCGDGPSAIDANLARPSGVAVAPDGSVYIADADGHRVRKVTTSGAISTVAGSGLPCPDPTSACGDGGAASAAQLASPHGLALGDDGSLYIADSATHRIRHVAPDGAITTVAGSGQPCPDSTTACGDGGPATSAMLRGPLDIALDADDALYIADTGDHRIRKVVGASITTIAGTGLACAVACGDGGLATGATLSLPAGVDVDVDDDVYVADTADNRVRRIAAGSGIITTIAGDGSPCAVITSPCGDSGPATSAKLTGPMGVAVSNGVVYVADTGAHKIRRVRGTIRAIAGTGEACAQPPNCGDGGAATAATLTLPAAVTFDARGDVVVADGGDNLVRWLTGPGESGDTPADGGDAQQPPVAATERQAGAAENAPATAATARKRKPSALLVRCNGSRCRLIKGGAAIDAKLRRRAAAARGSRSRASVELRRGGKTYATGVGRSLTLALTLVPRREITRRRYRLRITQTRPGERRKRDRIVRVR